MYVFTERKKNYSKSLVSLLFPSQMHRDYAWQQLRFKYFLDKAQKRKLYLRKTNALQNHGNYSVSFGNALNSFRCDQPNSGKDNKMLLSAAA